MKENIIIGLIVAFIGFLANKFSNIFKPNQLYLICKNPLDINNMTNYGYTLNLEVINKGNKIEEDILIYFNDAYHCKIISSNYISISAKSKIIKIDRILPASSIKLIVFISCDTPFNKKNLPTLKSKITKGKSYTNKNNCPPSASVALFYLILFSSCFLFIYLSIAKRDLMVKIFKYVHNTYYSYSYPNLYDNNLSFMNFYEDKPLFLSYFKEAPPAEIKELYKQDGINYYQLTLRNETPHSLIYKIDFNMSDSLSKSYYDEMSKAHQLHDILQEQNNENAYKLSYGIFIKKYEKLETYFTKQQQKIIIPPYKSKKLELNFDKNTYLTIYETDTLKINITDLESRKEINLLLKID